MTTETGGVPPGPPEMAAEAGAGDPGAGARALRGLPWVLASFASGRLLGLVTNLVVARLLLPADIGVVMTALVIVRTLNLLSDNGLAVSLVVRPELDDRMVGTVLTSMIVASVVLAGIVSALASPIASLFGEPRLSSVLPLLTTTVLFTSVAWLVSNLLQREMLFRPRFYGQVALAVSYAAVAIPLAALGAGVWSIVIGQVASAIVSAAVLWVAYPRRLVPVFDRERARTAYRESRSFISQSASSFLSANLHFIAVSSVLGARPMAIYSTSYRLAIVPATALSGPVSEATFPAYVELREDRDRRTAALLTAVRFVVVGALGPLVLLAVLSPVFVDAVLGARWHGMALTLAILCAWGAVTVPTETTGWFLNAAGEARFMARVNLVRLFFFAPAIFVAALVTHSVEWAAALLLGDVVYELTALLIRAHRRHGVHLRAVLAAVSATLAAGALGAAAAAAASAVLSGAGPWPRLLAGATAGAVTYAAALALLDRSLITQAVSLGRRALARG